MCPNDASPMPGGELFDIYSEQDFWGQAAGVAQNLKPLALKKTGALLGAKNWPRVNSRTLFRSLDGCFRINHLLFNTKLSATATASSGIYSWLVNTSS